MGMTVFFLYGALLLALGIHDAIRARAAARGDGTISVADDYYVNGRRSGSAQVALSIVASCVGGSATIGMAGLAWEVGLPAIWWLGSGACGLALLVRFMARKIRESGARTMPELVGIYLGSSARPLVSGIILLAWVAILAAQFSAMAAITATLTGFSQERAMLTGAVLITGYALLGGQASVIRSDVAQYVLLAAGFVLTLAFLLVSRPEPFAAMKWEVLSPAFPPLTLLRYLLVLGGSYVVCPMLFGRLLSARDSRVAAKGGGWAVAGLVLTALVIVLVGVGCRGLVPEGSSADQVLPALCGLLPPWLGLALMLALLSAVLSSADSCLLTAATVCCNDLARRDNVAFCRAAALLIGVAGFFLAREGQGVLALLFMANDVYVCGVVLPVFIGIVGGPRSVRPGPACAAVLAGGGLGLCSALTGNVGWAYGGLIVSLLLSLAGLAGNTPMRKTAARGA